MSGVRVPQRPPCPFVGLGVLIKSLWRVPANGGSLVVSRASGGRSLSVRGQRPDGGVDRHDLESLTASPGRATTSPPVVSSERYCVLRRGVSQLTSYVISAFGPVGRGLPRRERPSVDCLELTGEPVPPTLPPAEETTVGWHAPSFPEAGRCAAASLLAALLAVVLSVGRLRPRRDARCSFTRALARGHGGGRREETADSLRPGTRHQSSQDFREEKRSWNAFSFRAAGARR